MFIVNTENQFTLNSSVIFNPLGRNSIYASQITISIMSCLVSNPTNLNSLMGGALICIDCRSLLIQNTTFKYLYSAQGGALYIQETENNKRKTDGPKKYYILNTTFKNCTAEEGGAIYLTNPQYVRLENCLFFGNKANNRA